MSDIKREYTIIRDTNAKFKRNEEIKFDSFLPSLTTSSGPVEISRPDEALGADLSTETIIASENEIEDLKRNDSSIADVIPAMPLSLIAPPDLEEAKPFQLGESELLEGKNWAWGLEAIGVTNDLGDQVAMSEGLNVAAAVLDTGIDENHPAFAGLKVTKENFTAESNSDTHGHGTHVSGTFVGRNIDSFRFGVARDVERLYAAKVLGRGAAPSAIIDAIAWAIRKNKSDIAENAGHGGQQLLVINMSLGIDFPGHVRRLIEVHGFTIEEATALALSDYARNLRSLDGIGQLVNHSAPNEPRVLLIAASGNESDREKGLVLPASPPSEAQHFVSVGAVQKLSDAASRNLGITNFSNSNCVAVAPGAEVISAWPGNSFVSLAGTSMASPHLAGLAAIIWDEMVSKGQPLNKDTLLGELQTRSGRMPPLSHYNATDYGMGMVRL